MTPFSETQEYICPSGDVDWWKFSVSAPQEISLFLYGMPQAPPADYDLFLISPTQGLVASSERWGAEKDEYIHYTAWTSGDYRVLVRGKGVADWSKTTPYKLRADLLFPCFTPDEAGNTFKDATPLLPSLPQAGVIKKHTGYICPQGDIDFYKFEVSGGQTVTITADLTDLPADYDLILRRPDGDIADYSNNSGTADEHIVFVANNIPGAWRVSVFGPGGNYHSLSYQLEVALTGNADLSVQGIEVTQAIQDLNNSVPLIVGKMTFARVYVDVSGVVGPVTNISVDLLGWENRCGSWIPLPGSPLKLGPASVSPATLDQRRLSLPLSFNFILPKSWHVTLPGWCSGANRSIYLEARVNPVPTVPETDFTNNNLNRGALFTTRAPINLGIVPIRASGLVPSLTDPWYHAMIAHLRAVMPTHEVKVWVKAGGPLDANRNYANPGPPGQCSAEWSDLVDDMEDIYDSWSNRPPNAFVYGLLNIQVPHCAPAGGCTLGCGSPSANASTGILNSGAGPTVAHEIGHNLGRKHAPCSVPDPDPNWPSTTNPGAIIGEVGVNVVAGITYAPTTTFDTMSYCDAWSSPYTYNGMMNRLPGSAPPEMQVVPAQGATAPHLMASGRARDGQIELPRPFWIDKRPEGSHNQPGEGPYSLELQNASGTALFVRRFDSQGPNQGPDHVQDRFREVVPFPSGTVRIVFRYQGKIVRVVPISPHAPTVTVLSPNGGETWDTSGPYTITWQAADADGDPLVARVLYSADGGKTWEPLAVNLQSDHLQVNASDLPGSNNALVQVRVSDGVNTTADVSDAPFRVARKAALVFLLAPAERTHLLPGQSVFLQGLATDPEDGPLSGEALAWSSDVDGPLGEGTDVAVESLTPGPHRITLRATDGDGMVGSASVNIFVGYRVYLPLVLRNYP